MPNQAETLPNLNEKNETSANQLSMTAPTLGWLFGIVVLGFRCQISVIFRMQVSTTTASDPRTVGTKLAVPRAVWMSPVVPRAAFQIPVARRLVSRVLVWAAGP